MQTTPAKVQCGRGGQRESKGEKSSGISPRECQRNYRITSKQSVRQPGEDGGFRDSGGKWDPGREGELRHRPTRPRGADLLRDKASKGPRHGRSNIAPLSNEHILYFYIYNNNIESYLFFFLCFFFFFVFFCLVFFFTLFCWYFRRWGFLFF